MGERGERALACPGCSLQRGRKEPTKRRVLTGLAAHGDTQLHTWQRRPFVGGQSWKKHNETQGEIEREVCCSTVSQNANVLNEKRLNLPIKHAL